MAAVKSQPGTAKPYAKALFALAKERGQVEAVGTELGTLADLVARDDELRRFFARPWVAATVKRRVAAEIATRANVSKLLRDFMALVAAQGRVDHLGAIVDAYRDLVDADLGRVRARVRTVVRLTDAERATMVARLGRALGGRQVVLDEIVDATLLGGFVAESGSVIVDGSLDGQLARMRRRLAHG